ncbi:MAG: histidine kinase [Lewinellaceae bacterium]|nr:histidine kinase [Lewinellaceae bacterium]
MIREFLLLGLFFYLAPCFAFGQDNVEYYQIPIVPGIVKAENPIPLDSAIHWLSQDKFQPNPEIGTAKSGLEYWFAIDLSEYADVLATHDSIYFYPYGLELAQLYILPQGRIDSLNLSRMQQNDLHRSRSQNLYYVPIATQDFFAGNKLLLKAKFLRGKPNLGIRKFAFSLPEAHQVLAEYLSLRSFRSQVLAYFFLGVAAVLMVFNLVLFFNMKERQYIFYGAFLLFQLIYYSQISTTLAETFGYSMPQFYFWLTTISQVLINLSYLMFIRHFLEFPKVLPRFDRLVKAIAGLLVLFILFNSGLIILNPYSLLQAHLMNWQRYFMAGFAFAGIIYLYFSYPTRLKYFVIFGTLIFTSGALTTMFWLNLDYMVTGSAIESTIFALGLSYKIKTISAEKQLAEKETFQTKLGALRAQINPHFIFNSLSSIQYLISSGNKEAALSYLSKFSKFVRQVLENAIDVHVTLEKEIELLHVYLDLEALRFNNAFSYQIEMPPNADLRYQEVPMLVIQPFVENAIKHGLMPLEGRDRKVWIRFFELADAIVCEVEDNGIGRKAAAALKADHYRPSRGMALTEERLKMAHGVNSGSQIEIQDLPQGTKVIIKLPKL